MNLPLNHCSIQLMRNLDDPATYLVNNAGIQTWSTLVDLSLEDWNRTLRTNLTGCFLMTQRFARRCIAYNSSGANRQHRLRLQSIGVSITG